MFQHVVSSSLIVGCTDVTLLYVGGASVVDIVEIRVERHLESVSDIIVERSPNRVPRETNDKIYDILNVYFEAIVEFWSVSIGMKWHWALIKGVLHTGMRVFFPYKAIAILTRGRHSLQLPVIQKEERQRFFLW